MSDQPSIDSLFCSAIEIEAPDEREAFLQYACGNDQFLKGQVNRLLQAHFQGRSILDAPAHRVAAALDEPVSELPGVIIGSYKLLEQIGEGGMGTVWMAQQQEPVKRVVALKVIKAGMASKQIIARFEAERQALALMDHAHIARVLDGGTSSVGRPYFVMDLVKGVPITKYCDEHHLTPRQRLELFMPVCQAVQHAHQKGLIHRDLKPSNVLVALYDGKPVPKVIDFGIAKATGQALTDKTLVTGYGSIVGTLEYMSPEQAQINQLDVDTRSDIYSLGVLLYELLTGTTPLERKRVKQSSVFESLRIIREEDIPTLSNRLHTTEELPAIAANRGTEPAELTKLVRGELDWIVMKALDKDRNRRYETASALAADLTRYLADEPVLACPPSAVYRLRKFVRRHRSGLAMAGLVLVFLVLLGSMAGWAWHDRAARAAEQEIHLNQAIERAELLHREGKPGEALAALERTRLLTREAQSAPGLAERIDSLQQLLDAERRDEVFVAQFEAIRREAQTEVDVAKSVFHQEKGYPKLRAALEQYGITIGVTAPVAAVSHVQNRPSATQAVVVVALDECLRFVPREDSHNRQWLFDVLLKADSDPWRNQVRRAWTRSETLEALAQGIDVRQQPPSFLVLVAMGLPVQSPGRWHLVRSVQFAYPGDFWANHQLASDLYGAGKHAEAIRYYTAALSLRPDNPGVLANRGRALLGAGELEAASADLRRAVAVAPRYAVAHRELGHVFGLQGKLDEANAAYREAIRLEPDNSHAHHAFGCFLRSIEHDSKGAIDCFHRALELDPTRVQFHIELVHALRQHGKLDDAIDTCQRALRLDPKNVHVHAALAQCLRLQGKLDDAIGTYRKAIELDPKTVYIHTDLGHVLGMRGKLDEAVAAYQEAIRLQPDKAQAHHAFACFLRDLKRDYAAAIGCFHKALELDPNNASIHYDFGHTLLRHRKLDEAVAAFRKAIRLKPDTGGAREALAWVLNNLAWTLATSPEPAGRDSGRAVSLAKEADELKPHQGNYVNTLGVALYRAGNWKDAIETLERADHLSGGKQFGSNAFFIAMAHRQLDNMAEAHRWFDRAVEWMNRNQPKNEELLRFRTEAADLLNLQEKK